MSLFKHHCEVHRVSDTELNMFQKTICLLIVPLLLANLSLSQFAHTHKSIELEGFDSHNSRPHLHQHHHSHHETSHHHDENSEKSDSSQDQNLASNEISLSLDKPMEHDSDVVYITELVSSAQSGNWISDTFWDQLIGSSFLQASLLNEDGSKNLNRPQRFHEPGITAHCPHCPLYLRTLSLRI